MSTSISLRAIAIPLIFCAFFCLSLIKQVQANVNACWTVGSDGWTVICATPVTFGSCAAGTANGTCIVYVDAGSTGSCTPQMPPVQQDPAPNTFQCSTINEAYEKLRNGNPDWMLLKKNDVWTNQTLGQIRISGKSAKAPLLISSYGKGARPLIKTPAKTAAITTTGSKGGGSGGDYLALVGLEFYCYTRDPNNKSYEKTGIRAEGVFFTNSFNWLLIEDVKISFYSDNVVIEPSKGGSLFYFRRNVVTDAYTNDRFGHSQGIFMSRVRNAFLDGNYFDRNGWNATLSGDTTVTISQASPAAVTWANNLGPADGDSVIFRLSGGGITAGRPYKVLNASGSTFEISVDGLTPIGTTMGLVAQQKASWLNTARNIFNRNVYLDEYNGPVTFKENISTWSASEGAQQRSGGISYNNLFVRNSYGWHSGGCSAGMGCQPIRYINAYDNVIMESNAISPNTTNQILERGVGISIAYSNGPDIFVHDNIIANSKSTGPGLLIKSSSGVIMRNNIVCNWLTGLLDYGGVNNTAQNIFRTENCNNLGPAPSRTVETYDRDVLKGPGTLADFIARERLQTKDSWNPALSAAAVNDYIRAGFAR